MIVTKTSAWYGPHLTQIFCRSRIFTYSCTIDCHMVHLKRSFLAFFTLQYSICLFVLLLDIFRQPVVNACEELEVMWAVAEADMQQLARDGLVPSSSIDSGGM